MIDNLSKLTKVIQKNGKKTMVLKTDRFGRPLLSLNLAKKPLKVEQHDMAVDLSYIISGSGILEKGGEIEEKTFRSIHEWRGTNLINPEKIVVKKGDMITINSGIPHRLAPKQALSFITYKNYLSDYIESEKLSADLKKKIKNIKGIIMDVDGTMTDGKVWVNQDGEEFASFSRIDSLGLEQMQKANFKIGMISKEKVSIATARAKKLKIECFIGIDDKISQAHKLIERWKLNFSEVCFIGDDINDIPLLKKVGFSTCPNDAHPLVLTTVNLILPKKRGDHVIRNLTDLILIIQQSNYGQI